MLVGGILDGSPASGVLLNHFPTQSTLIFFSSPSVYLKVEEGTTISLQPHKMVFHKVSPTICILLSVLLLFLSQETLSRELIQVAPYGKYFSLSHGLGVSSYCVYFMQTCKIYFWFGFLQKIKLCTWMARYLEAAPIGAKVQWRHAHLLPISSVPLPPSNLGDALMFLP